MENEIEKNNNSEEIENTNKNGHSFNNSHHRGKNNFHKGHRFNRESDSHSDSVEKHSGEEQGADNQNGENSRRMIEKIAALSDEVKTLKEQVEKLEEEKSKLNNEMLLVRADAENYRKRADKDRMESVSFANKRIIEDMLPSLDSIDIAVSTILDESVKKGVELISSTMMTALGKWGLEIVAPLDEEFDPLCCEACMFEERDGIEVDMVIQVLQKGYKLNGKIIRPAKVKIAKAKS